MRSSSTRTRLACAGLTTGAVIAALLVAPGAAFAVALTSVAPAAGAPGTTITATLTGAFTGDGAGGLFTTATTCPTTYNTTAPSVAAGSPTKLTANAATFVVPTLTLGTGGVAKTYGFCAYVGTTVGTSAAINDVPYNFSVTPGGATTPASAPSGGGNTVTFTLPSTSAILPTTTPGVTFSATGCATTYGSPTNPSATVTRTSTTVLTAVVPAGVMGTGVTTPYSVCVYSGAVSGSTLLATSNGYSVTLPSVSLSSTIGPVSTVQNPVNITLTSTANFLTGVTAPVATLVSSPTLAPVACSALYTTPGTNLGTTVRKLANNKGALMIPIGATLISSAATPYNVCVYSSNSTTTGKLLTAVTYTVANVPTIAAVTPNSGPALGGSTITVTGSNFPTTGTFTAMLGGMTLTSINVIDSGTFTAVTPAHAIGGTTLVVSSATGSDSLASAYSYVNSITVAPNTAPNTATSQDVDVQGTGFMNLTFGGAANSTAGHIYLTNGVYNSAAGTGNTTMKQNGGVAECGNVLVISDTELVCSLNLTVSLDPTGTSVVNTTYRATPVAAVSTSSTIVVLTSGTFMPNDVGQPIVQGSAIPAGTTIVAVISPTTAVMSAAATLTAAAVTIGYQSGSITAAGSSTISPYTVTGLAGVFTQADVGRLATGTGVGTNAVVTAVDPTGATATLSVANTAAVTSVVLASGNSVPNGAYSLTVVSDGSINGYSNTGYTQSVISSGSTFTVAPF